MTNKQKMIPALGQLMGQPDCPNKTQPYSPENNSIDELLKCAERLGFSKSEINALNANYAKTYSSFLQ